MARFLISASEFSWYAENAPAFQNIQTALRGIRWADAGTHWLSSAPRVTRQTTTAIADRRVTNVADVLEVTDAAIAQRGGRAAVVALIQNAVYGALSGISDSDWSPESADPTPAQAITVADYDYRLHGAPQWWENGDNWKTQTRDRFPDELGITQQENPIGPDDPALRVPSLLRRVTGDEDPPGEGPGSYLKFLVYGAGALMLLYFGIQVVGMIRAGQKTAPLPSLPPPQRRANPAPGSLPLPSQYQALLGRRTGGTQQRRLLPQAEQEGWVL